MNGIIKLILVLVVGVLIYNYFLGSEEEKQESEKIFTEVKELGKATWGLLKSEKQKFNDGKYDEAVGKVSSLLSSLRNKANTSNDKAAVQELEQLEGKRQQLEKELAELERLKQSGKNNAAATKEEQIKKDWKTLMDATELVMKNMESK
jgi:ElaB/YqjD/DUF883 family membrane-anchored ribosome-binding protein